MEWELIGGAERPRGHTYSTEMIARAIELVLQANSSLRGAAKSLGICGKEEGAGCPSLWSVRNWVLRLGLYEIQRPKGVGTDWVWILDHTLQIGSHKALLILGARLDERSEGAMALGHQEVEVLGLEIWEHSSAQRVLERLEGIAGQVGVPRLLVSDEGSDLKKAAGIFCDRHPPTDWISDVSHRMARILEGELKGDERWEGFLRETALCRNRCQQTQMSPLMPPGQRSKARWMNYKPLLTWAVKLLENPIPEWADRRQHQRLFGWMREYQDDIQEYWLMLHMGEEIGRMIKTGGIEPEQLERCRETLNEMATSPRLRRQAEGIREYLAEVESKVRPGERLMGSSDIIESIFGKYKLLVERSPQKALSRLILAIGSLTSKRTPEIIREAMEQVSLQRVEEWFRGYVPQTDGSLRRRALV